MVGHPYLHTDLNREKDARVAIAIRADLDFTAAIAAAGEQFAPLRLTSCQHCLG